MPETRPFRTLIFSAAFLAAFAFATALEAIADGPGASSEAAKPAPKTEFQLLKRESQAGGYSIELPLLWEIRDGLKGWDCVAFAPESGPSDVYLGNISIVAAKDGKPCGAAADAFLQEAKGSLQSFSFISKGTCSVGQLEGASLEFIHVSDGTRLGTRKVFLSDGKTLWSLTFTALPEDFKKFKPLFNAVELSFKPLLQ